MNIEDQFERFARKVLITDTCWLWTGGKASLSKYGTFYFYPGKLKLAHRVSYELFKGKIPEGMHIDHLCCVPACVNPLHLESVTVQENVLRSRVAIPCSHGKRARSHCDECAVMSLGPRSFLWRRLKIEGKGIVHVDLR